MAVINDTATGGLEVRIRDDYTATGSIGAVNAEVALACRGSNEVVISLVGASAPNLVVSFEGSIDGTNYLAIPALRLDTSALVLTHTVNVTTPIAFVVPSAGWSLIRVRVSTFTAGSVTVTMRGATGAGPALPLQQPPYPSSLHVTNTAAVNTAVTLTLPAPGAGLRHYITRIRIERLYSVVGVAAAAANNVTSTNLPGSPIFGFSQSAAGQGTLEVADMPFPAPVQATALNTNTTLVAPAQLQTIWRVSAWYYVAP